MGMSWSRMQSILDHCDEGAEGEAGDAAYPVRSRLDFIPFAHPLIHPSLLPETLPPACPLEAHGVGPRRIFLPNISSR